MSFRFSIDEFVDLLDNKGFLPDYSTVEEQKHILKKHRFGFGETDKYIQFKINENDNYVSSNLRSSRGGNVITDVEYMGELMVPLEYFSKGMPQFLAKQLAKQNDISFLASYGGKGSVFASGQIRSVRHFNRAIETVNKATEAMRALYKEDIYKPVSILQSFGLELEI